MRWIGQNWLGLVTLGMLGFSCGVLRHGVAGPGLSREQCIGALIPCAAVMLLAGGKVLWGILSE